MASFEEVRALPDATEIDFDTFNGLPLAGMVRYLKVQLDTLNDEVRAMAEKLRRVTSLHTSLLDRVAKEVGE